MFYTGNMLSKKQKRFKNNSINNGALYDHQSTKVGFHKPY